MIDQKNMKVLILAEATDNDSISAVMELLPMMQIDPSCVKIDLAINDKNYNNYFFDGLLNRLFVSKVEADKVTEMHMDLFSQPVNMTDMRQYSVMVCCLSKMSEKFIGFLYKNFPDMKLMEYQCGKNLNNVMPSVKRQMA